MDYNLLEENKVFPFLAKKAELSYSQKLTHYLHNSENIMRDTGIYWVLGTRDNIVMY